VGLKAVEECCWCAELGERVERNTSLLFVETEDNCSCVMHTVSELLQHTLPTRQRALALASCTQLGTFAALSAEPVNVIVLGCALALHRRVSMFAVRSMCSNRDNNRASKC
jgi:hypothetical protein